MKKLVVANWKMNMDSSSILQYFSAFQPSALTQQVICPPFVYISLVKKCVPEGVLVGAQNCFFEQRGAFTGEVSAEMLRDIGASYVIVGHSERRCLFMESQEVINRKVRAVLSAGLTPILCVGEQATEKNRRDSVVSRQLELALENVEEEREVVVAYEPVWAIGSGETPDAAECKEIVTRIKNFRKNLTVLYGGSVDDKNFHQFLQIADGLLVGGASLDPQKFSKICSGLNES